MLWCMTDVFGIAVVAVVSEKRNFETCGHCHAHDMPGAVLPGLLSEGMVPILT